MVGQPLPTRHQIPGSRRFTVSGAARLSMVGQLLLPQTHAPAHLIPGRAAGLRSVPPLAGSPSLHSAGLSQP